MPVHAATTADIPLLILLINRAYRGAESRKGWTTEAHLLDGELRTDEKDLLDLMQMPDATFLKYVNESGVIEGAVFLKKFDDKMYLGMLSVSPILQSRGIGRQLMAGAESYARRCSCKAIFMKVISVRQELIAWYERKGYYKTGDREPFPASNKFGIPTQPLEFIIMEKTID